MTATNTVYLCPQCSSPSLSTPVLAGGEYACEACGWSGQDPVAVPFGNPFGTADATFRQFTQEVLNEFAKYSALPLGRVLVKWGFVEVVEGKPSTKQLARLIKAMAGGAILAMIDERKRIEVERVAPHADGH
jgi:hypothetical protein